MSKTPLLDLIEYPADLRRLDKKDLPQLSEELRAEMIDAVSITGGHLGAGLGVVELTAAIHYVFNTPEDKLIWDVGHQAYPHKILTGRRSRIRTLRQCGGLSGFTRRSESGYDPLIISKTNDVGIFQVNLAAHWDTIPGQTRTEKILWLQNPTNNIQFAYMLFTKRGNWDDWVCYTRGLI